MINTIIPSGLTKENFKPNKYFITTGRQKSWLKGGNKVLPVSCTVIDVHDSLLDVDTDQYGQDQFHFYETIAGSRVYLTHAIKSSCGVAVNLSKIRSKGTVGTGGLISQGVCNFMKIYSEINEEIVRGSVYKNGAVVLYLDCLHSDLQDFLEFPASKTPWAKRAVYVNDSLFLPENQERLNLILHYLELGIIFIAKENFNADGERLFSNVCLTADTMIKTNEGEIPISELIGVPFTGLINHLKVQTKECHIRDEELNIIATLPKGFFPTGKQFVYKLNCDNGRSIKATAKHKFSVKDRGMLKVDQLFMGAELELEFSEFTKLISIELGEIEDVFCCHIDHPSHLFVANGFITENCMEILIKSRNTCTLGHVNLGLIDNPFKIPEAICDSMVDLINLWKLAIPDITKCNYYDDPTNDPQVGLGLVGLANLLCNLGCTYLDFVIAMERIVNGYYEDGDSDSYPEDINPVAYAIAISIADGYGLAMEVALETGLNRFFTIAPTTTCAFQYQDLNGYAVSPEISPPVADLNTKKVRRISERNGDGKGYEDFQYPPNIELAGHHVSWEVYDRLVNVFQTLMNDTSGGHTISYNWWLSKPVNYETFTDWYKSVSQTIYYRWDEFSDQNSKVSIQIETTQEDEDFWSGFRPNTENDHQESINYDLDDIKTELEQSISAVAQEQWFWGDDDTLELEPLPSKLEVSPEICEVRTQNNDPLPCQSCSGL
jgi:hypothetical protein